MHPKIPLHVLPEQTLHTMRRHLCRASLALGKTRKKADTVELRIRDGEIVDFIRFIDCELLARSGGES